VYVINMDGANARLAAFQHTFEASDLRAKNFVRFPAVNGSALDAARLVSPKALAEISAGGWS
jgi:GR25 family glycosyltransferase involved in LPS biosynthesis